MARAPRLLLFLTLLLLAAPVRALDVCIGDCNGNGVVGIDELLVGVNEALGLEAVARCPSFDANDDGHLAVNELLGAVRSALDGCRAADPPPTATPEAPPTATPRAEFVAAAEDFACLTDWTRVRHFRIANPLGHLDEAVAVAHGDQPPPYPIGTIIQLVPTEAMVKRGAGFFPEANDWEFFVLSPSAGGTAIAQRGRAEVVNIGQPCFACHGAAPQTDFVCENGNGCIALGLSEALIDALQNGDPRCAPRAPIP